MQESEVKNQTTELYNKKSIFEQMGTSGTVQLCKLRCDQPVRHANLCSGLRAILSPQFIKKEFAILSILPRKWHRQRR